MTEAPQRVMVVDDHPIIREGLAALIGAEADLLVCGQAGSYDEAIETLESAKPDLVVVDLIMPGKGGLELLSRLRRTAEHIPVLVLSMHTEPAYAERALQGGASGYVSKGEATKDLVAAIRRVLRGEIYVSRGVAMELIGHMVRGGKAVSSPHWLSRLSPRELQVFERIGHGLRAREIAEELSVSIKTVETHIANIRRKMGFKNSSDMAYHAIHWISSAATDPAS